MGTRVFLSSTGADLQDQRDAAYEAIKLAGAECVRMEDFAADPRTPAEVCADEVAKSDLLIGLVGFHYGGRVPPEKSRSFTQLEIETAEAQEPAEVPPYFFVAPVGAKLAMTEQDGADLDAQRALRDRLREERTIGRPEHWDHPYKLALQIQSIVIKALMPEMPEVERY